MEENRAGYFPRITERNLDDLSAQKGVKIAREPEPWCTEATRENICHYAHGIGDDDLIWCDPEYAVGTSYGGTVALPSFLFSCSRIISGYVGGLPRVHAMWAGAKLAWHTRILRNEGDLAITVGAPGTYDCGPERCSWMTHHLTNWIGDDGFLKRSNTKIRSHNREVDTLLIDGSVTAINDDPITIFHEARNQDADVSIIGVGEVRIPMWGR